MVEMKAYLAILVVLMIYSAVIKGFWLWTCSLPKRDPRWETLDVILQSVLAVWGLTILFS